VALSRHRLWSRECRESRQESVKVSAQPVTAVLTPPLGAHEGETTPLAP
jgi:hypothetical protein